MADEQKDLNDTRKRNIQSIIHQDDDGALDLTLPKRQRNDNVNIGDEILDNTDPINLTTKPDVPYIIEPDKTIKQWKRVIEEKSYKVRFLEEKAGMSKKIYFFKISS